MVYLMHISVKAGLDPYLVTLKVFLPEFLKLKSEIIFIIETSKYKPGESTRCSEWKLSGMLKPGRNTFRVTKYGSRPAFIH